MRLFEAIAQGFSLLEVLGELFPSKEYKVLLVLDLLKTKRMTKSFYSDLQTLRLMNDERKETAMQILNLIFPYCLILKHPKAPFAIFRMVQISMRYGFTATSTTGLAILPNRGLPSGTFAKACRCIEAGALRSRSNT